MLCKSLRRTKAERVENACFGDTSGRNLDNEETCTCDKAASDRRTGTLLLVILE